jgi:hypothetical protein
MLVVQISQSNLLQSRSRRAQRHPGFISSVLVACLCSTAVLSGCLGLKPYQNTAEHNLHIHTAVDAGSWFSSVRAAIDIHRVVSDCKTVYEGTVQLNRPGLDIGIPPDRLSQLVFVFASYSFLGNRSSSMTYETLLKPRSGYQYDVQVTYKDDMYNVAIRETPPNSSVSREIDHKDLHSCRRK